MDSSHSPQNGTVANRIRVFQDVQQLQTQIPSFTLPPRALREARDASLFSGQGRSRVSKFTPPAGRVSMDGNEGIGGDGRPSGASQGDRHEIVPVRPFTSMDGPGDEKPSVHWPALRQVGHQLRRQHRSMENVADDPALEIAMARSRLRSVAPTQATVQEEPSRGRSYTMDELNTMLDDAIKNSSPQPEVTSSEQPVNLAPKPGFVLRRASTRQARRPSQRRPRSRGVSTESVAPRSSEESTRVAYEGEKETEQPRQHDMSSKQPQKPVSPAAPWSKPPADPAGSPVKQRAAMFESLNRKPTGHEQVCQHFGHEHEPSHQHQHRPTKKIHRIKFGDTIEERPGTPLIPLTLPTLVSQEKTSRPPSSMKQEPVASELPYPIEEETASDDVFKEGRKPSISWPFRWSIFKKGASAPAQETDTPAVDAGTKDEHYPTTRPSIVRSKVQDLLQAANEKDDAEQRRRNAERDRLSRRPTRAETPRRQTEANRDETRQEKMVDPKPETPGKELIQKMPTETDDKKPPPRTPLQRAMSEKQVLAPPTRADQEGESGSSPRKPPPQTPIRGRSISTHRPSFGEQKRAVQQQFSLSPGPSRNGSKQRQGVKVEVEIRDSPEREARERGDKIVIIRADVSEVDGGGAGSPIWESAD
ncbi:uncharacterized protein Z520_05543 [Fonsecaea multimorphosa CBS 102226]|uniref:Uncharacterized protein n=1 Tax=Fonsecaea multimorphosa CBS 102226 TaxID=1442371 RepID=A0A0D2JZX0_9EURO|nr:uncharacterized protein Z520_05543 [Fonsecaea multimorphosa CBS 102226]KIX99082.1 hypothetical protein Z520_05543 [Fonsecaea multimorphosa CBS 102226]OAL25344.1 hypothetical protein AYO22_05221 [Fonsecaea multimorphosa]